MKDFFKGIVLALSILLCAGQAQAADASAKGKATAGTSRGDGEQGSSLSQENGKEKRLLNSTTPMANSSTGICNIYAFLTNGDGIERANGANLKLVGKNVLEMKDADGQYLIKNILAVADTPAGEAWLEYKWVNPVTHAIDKKKAFVKKVGDVLLGCGIYE